MGEEEEVKERRSKRETGFTVSFLSSLLSWTTKYYATYVFVCCIAAIIRNVHAHAHAHESVTTSFRSDFLLYYITHCQRTNISIAERGDILGPWAYYMFALIPS